jgi:hypothetical protein
MARQCSWFSFGGEVADSQLTHIDYPISEHTEVLRQGLLSTGVEFGHGEPHRRGAEAPSPACQIATPADRTTGGEASRI